MVAIFCDEIVCVSFVLFSETSHYPSHFLWTHIRPSDQNRLPEAETIALFRLSFEYPRRGILVGPEGVLNSMNCDTSNHKSLSSNAGKKKFKSKQNYQLVWLPRKFRSKVFSTNVTNLICFADS